METKLVNKKYIYIFYQFCLVYILYNKQISTCTCVYVHIKTWVHLHIQTTYMHAGTYKDVHELFI